MEGSKVLTCSQTNQVSKIRFLGYRTGNERGWHYGS